MASAAGFLLAAATAAPADNAAFHPPVFQFQNDAFAPCAVVTDAIASCEAATPTIYEGGPTDFAKCWCCDGSTYDPEPFEDAASSCYDVVTVAIPEETDLVQIFSIASELCGAVGSVPCGGSGGSPATTTRAPSPTGTSGSGSGSGGSGASTGCASLASIVNSCSSAIPTFSAASDYDIAGCACYDGNEWVPDELDDFIDDCASWAVTGDPELYDVVTPLEDFCSAIGPVTVVTAEDPTTVRTAAGGDITTAPEQTTGGGSGLGGLGGSNDEPSSTTTEVVTPSPGAAAGPVQGGSGVGFLAGLVGMFFLV